MLADFQLTWSIRKVQTSPQIEQKKSLEHEKHQRLENLKEYVEIGDELRDQWVPSKELPREVPNPTKSVLFRTKPLKNQN